MSLPSSGALASPDLLGEVFRNVGRNILICQQAEQYLKVLLAHSSIEATTAGLTPACEQRQAFVRKQTLGALTTIAFRDLLQDAGSDPEAPSQDETVPTFRTSFKITLEGGQDLTRLQDQFSAFVIERNELVHHFLETFSLATDDSARVAVAHLVEQRARIAPVRDVLRSWLETIASAQKDLASFIASDQGQGAIELFVLQASPIVELLATAAGTFKRADGWTLLSTAGHYLRRERPEELTTMKQRYGHSTLKRLVLACELFEVRDEPLPFGTRAVYRIKPELLAAE